MNLDTGKGNAPLSGVPGTSLYRAGRRTRIGRRTKKAWEGENPKKETFKLWVQFIKDNFQDGGGPAGLEGAPSFSDYKDSTKKGAGP